MTCTYQALRNPHITAAFAIALELPAEAEIAKHRGQGKTVVQLPGFSSK